MRKPIFVPLLAALALLLQTGCGSARRDFERRLTATWQVVQYKNERQELRRDMAAPILYRSITFERRGRGRVSTSSEFSAEKGNNGFDFEWSCTENTVTMRGFDADFARSWIVVENDRRHQIWKSTDGANNVQTLELRR
jgi:hypothetical protein